MDYTLMHYNVMVNSISLFLYLKSSLANLSPQLNDGNALTSKLIGLGGKGL